MTTRYERLQSVGLAILLTVGAAAAWFVVSGLSLAFVENFFFRHEAGTASLCLLDDWTPAFEIYWGSAHRTTYRALDGRPLNRDLFKGDQFFDSSWNYLAGPPHGDSGPRNLTWGQRIARARFWHESGPYSGNTQGYGCWYFIHDSAPRGRGYFVGYRSTTDLKDGYIGRRGFRTDEPPPEDRFPVDVRRWAHDSLLVPNSSSSDGPEHIYLASTDGLFRIGLAQGSVAPLWQDDNLIAADFWQPMLPSNTPAGRQTEAILVRTRERILVLDMDGKQVAAYPLPAELRDRDLICHRSADKKVMLCQTVPTTHAADIRELFWIDTAGRIVRQQRVDPAVLLPLGTGEDELVWYNASRLGMRQTILAESPFQRGKESVFNTIAIPAPATLVGLMACYPWLGDEVPASANYSTALHRALAQQWPALPMTAAIGLVLAVLCFRRQRQLWPRRHVVLDAVCAVVWAAGLLRLLDPSILGRPAAMPKLPTSRPARSPGMFCLRQRISRAGRQGD